MEQYNGSIGDVVQYVQDKDTPSSTYLHGGIYEKIGESVTREDVTFPAGTEEMTFTFRNGSQLKAYSTEADSINKEIDWQRDWTITPKNGGTFTATNGWVKIPTLFTLLHVGDAVVYYDNGVPVSGKVTDVVFEILNARPLTNDNYSYVLHADTQQDAFLKYKDIVEAAGHEYTTIYGFVEVRTVEVTMENGDVYEMSGLTNSRGDIYSYVKKLRATDGRIIYALSKYSDFDPSFSYYAYEVRASNIRIRDGEIQTSARTSMYVMCGPELNTSTVASTTLSSPTTISIPVLPVDYEGNPYDPGDPWALLIAPTEQLWAEETF